MLPDGWRVQAKRKRVRAAELRRCVHDRARHGRRRWRGGGTGGGGTGGGGQHPATGRACPAPFTVENNDRIGSLKLPEGKYRITLLAVGR